MQFAHRVRLRQDEDVVIAAQIGRPIGKAPAAIAGLAELEPLDFRAHGAIEHENALAGATAQFGFDGRWGEGGHATVSCARTPSR